MFWILMIIMSFNRFKCWVDRNFQKLFCSTKFLLFTSVLCFGPVLQYLTFQTGQKTGRRIRRQVNLLAVGLGGRSHCSPQGQQAGQGCPWSEVQHGDVWKEAALYGKVQGKDLRKNTKFLQIKNLNVINSQL